MTVVGIATVELRGGARQFISTMEGAARKFEAIGKRMENVGRGLTATLTLPILAVAFAAGKAAIDFESSFAGIRKTMNLTEAEFGRLAQANRNLAKTIPVSVNELNRIGELAGQLGVRGVGNVLKFEDTIAKLAVTTDLTADTAALAFAQISNVLQLPQGQIDRLGSAVVGLGNNFATVESKIVEFAQRISGAGKIAKLSAGDVVGIGTAFASLGVEAEAGGTAVQKVLLSMLTAVVQGGKELTLFAQTAGVSADQFRAAFEQDAAGAFVSFVEGLGTQGNHAIATLEKLGLTDQRLTRSFLAAAGAGDLLRRAVTQGNAEFEANNALSEEAAKRFDTAASKLTLFWSRVKDTAITLGGALVPVLLTALDTFDPFVQVIEGAVVAFTTLTPATQRMAIAFAAVAAAAGPVLIVLGKVIATLSLLLNPFVAIAAVAVTAIVGIKNNWLGMGEAAANVWATIADIVPRVLGAVMGAFKPWINFMLGAFRSVGAIGWIVFDELIRKPAVAAFKAIFNWAKPVLSAVATALAFLGKIGEKAAETIRDAFSFAGDVAEEEGFEIGARIADAIVDAFSTDYVGAFVGVVTAGIDKVKDVIARAIAFLRSMSGGGGEIAAELEDIAFQLKEATTGVVELTHESGRLRELADTVDGIALSFTDTLGDAITGAGIRLKDFVKFAIGELAKLAARIILFRALTGIFGGPALAGFFGENLLGFDLPARAHGGPVRRSQPYMVGERGAEMFVPHSAGSIIANDGLASGGSAIVQADPPRSPDPLTVAANNYWQQLYRETARVAAAQGFHLELRFS
jgi:TP901 family phage tail tape measure protein